MRRVLLAAVLGAAILVDGFFALVNFYPVAPARSRGPRRRVVMALDGVQARWLREHLLAEFNAEYNVDVEVQAVPEEQLLEVLKRGGDDLLLATLPRARGERVIREKLVRPFDELIDADQIGADLDGVSARAMAAARLDGKQAFLPRYSTVDVAVFRVSKVRDAVRHWQLLRPQIDAALRAANGKGLPAGYQLELEPQLWDSTDRFVIGYYWAHRRYKGERARGRVGHRTGEVLDGELDITEALFRAGATTATLAQTDSPAARDYFGWETLYRQHGIYADAMFEPKPFDDDAVLDGLQKGELFLATIDTMEAFTLHGGGHQGAPPHVDDPDDLGFAPLARISSIEDDEHGKPRRAGQAIAYRDDWVWALPSGSPDPQLAYQLIAFLWTRDSHYRECEALGTLPLRSDVVHQRSSLFRMVWMDDILDASFAEWDRALPVPESVEEKWGSIYAQLWDRVVRQRAAIADHPDQLAAILRAPPAARPPSAPPLPAVAAVATPDRPAEDELDDPIDQIDDELWRGEVQLDTGKGATK